MPFGTLKKHKTSAESCPQISVVYKLSCSYVCLFCFRFLKKNECKLFLAYWKRIFYHGYHRSNFSSQWQANIVGTRCCSHFFQFKWIFLSCIVPDSRICFVLFFSIVMGKQTQLNEETLESIGHSCDRLSLFSSLYSFIMMTQLEFKFDMVVLRVTVSPVDHIRRLHLWQAPGSGCQLTETLLSFTKWCCI